MSQEIFFSSVFTAEPDGDIPHIPPVKLRHNMEELTIDKKWKKKFAFSSSSVVVWDFGFVWSIFSSPIPCLTVFFYL